MLKISSHNRERLQHMHNLPRKTARGFSSFVKGATLAPLSLLNVAAPNKMSSVNRKIHGHFKRSSTGLKEIYVEGNGILRPKTPTDKENNVIGLEESLNQDIDNRLTEVALTIGKKRRSPRIKARLRYLRVGTPVILRDIARMSHGSLTSIATLPFSKSNYKFQMLNYLTISNSVGGRLPQDIFTVTLGLIKPRAAAALTNPSLFDEQPMNQPDDEIIICSDSSDSESVIILDE